MKTYQYTIRNVPAPVDQYLRKRARLSGKSLNQVVLDELSQHIITPQQSVIDSLDWFIGTGMDQDVLDALAEEDRQQKALYEKEMKKIDDLGY